jgi:primosomal protein N'
MKEGKAQAAAYLVEVTPVTKSPSAESLTYFSGTKLAAGTFVRIPVRKSLVPAIVTRCRDVRSAKSEIRRAGFLLKKISRKDVSEAVLPRDIMDALDATARYYAAPVGSLLSALMPKMLLEEPERYFSPINSKRKKPEHMPETLLLQMESEERFGQYRALVRQAFARDSSVMFVVPTHLDIHKAKTELSKGIEPFVHVFSLEHKKEASWEKARREKHPVLFITTPAGLSFTRPDLDAIILERENSRAYRTLSRPYIHLKVLIENICRAGRKQLAIGDSILSIETLWREKNGEYGESALIRWRLPAAPTALVDGSTKQNESGRFEIFSRELKELLARAVEERQPIFLFGARKGLAPTTVCGDCGFVLPCLNCGAPVVLHRQHETTVYVCHACRARRDSTTTCGYCGSWKLVPLGIGIEEIARQARELFPGTPIHILDKDHASTDRQAAKVAQAFKAEGGILVGTELAFFHVSQVPYSALVSIDSLFSVPDFGINERIFYLVSRLREMTKTESLVQTRNIGKQVLAWSAFGNIIDFYQGEIADREALLYPPFSVFIKATSLKKDAGHELASAKERLSRWKPDILKDSLVMRIPRGVWPDAELVRELSLLGREFSVKVDPESIL